MNAPLSPPVVVLDKVDPRLVFLALAAARFDLVRAGKMEVDEAFYDLINNRCVCPLADWIADD